METRIAVTPSEDSVIHPQLLLQCYSGLLYLQIHRDPETRRSVFEIRGDIPPAALQILEQQLTLRGAVFEIFEVEVIAVTGLEAEIEDVDEFEDETELAELTQQSDVYDKQDIQEWRVVARA